MDTNFRKPLELKPTRIGRPRFDRESKILARFYEPLSLLRALGQTRGAHTRQPRNTNDATEKRRKFLENLCFVCDFRKGGKTCTAIALEDCSSKYQFWTSSNGKNSGIVEFLREALRFLCGTSHLTGMQQVAKENEFTEFCAAFARNRIEGERKLVQAQATECVLKLQNRTTRRGRRDEELIRMLQQIIDENDLIKLCAFSYQHRRSTWMTELKALASNEERELGLQAMRSSFFLVRHHIGRLSHHIRAPKELIQLSNHMENILENHTVMVVDHLPSIQPPPRDTHTNLEGIMNRMFKKDNEKEKKFVKEALIHLDRVSGIFKSFLDFYEQPSVQVHAEIEVLEHFHRSQLVFAGNDRFVACSKPACLCCELYFQYHPARPVIPSSHKNVWTRWSPPKMEYSAAMGDMAIQQRKILSKITDDLREQIIDQVLQRSTHSLWHPDSRTGITTSQSMSYRVFSAESEVSEISEIESDLDSSDSSDGEMWSDSEDGGVFV